jgi:hypothetical protein
MLPAAQRLAALAHERDLAQPLSQSGQRNHRVAQNQVLYTQRRRACAYGSQRDGWEMRADVSMMYEAGACTSMTYKTRWLEFETRKRLGFTPV